MITSKSPRQVLFTAWQIGTATLRPYAHRFSPKKFTQPQLFACLVLKEFLKLDYCGLAALLKDTTQLQNTIGLKKVPHFTTFQKASRRLLRFRRAKRMLRETVRRATKKRLIKKKVRLAAMDATGLESHHASRYYVQRKAKGGKTGQNIHYKRFPKMAVVCDCASHFVLALVTGRGPGPDITHYRKALNQALQAVGIETLAADAGYDSEASHQYARNTCHVRTLIPPLVGRPTDKPPSGYWRRQMKSRLHLTRYGQRWQVETVNSMLKRLLGSALRARTYWNQQREMFLMVLTLNIMILAALILKLFYKAVQDSLCKRVLPLFFAHQEGRVVVVLRKHLAPRVAAIQHVVTHIPNRGS